MSFDVGDNINRPKIESQEDLQNYSNRVQGYNDAFDKVVNIFEDSNGRPTNEYWELRNQTIFDSAGYRTTSGSKLDKAIGTLVDLDGDGKLGEDEFKYLMDEIHSTVGWNHSGITYGDMYEVAKDIKARVNANLKIERDKMSAADTSKASGASVEQAQAALNSGKQAGSGASVEEAQAALNSGKQAGSGASVEEAQAALNGSGKSSAKPASGEYTGDLPEIKYTNAGQAQITVQRNGKEVQWWVEAKTDKKDGVTKLYGGGNSEVTPDMIPDELDANQLIQNLQTIKETGSTAGLPDARVNKVVIPETPQERIEASAEILANATPASDISNPRNINKPIFTEDSFANGDVDINQALTDFGFNTKKGALSASAQAVAAMLDVDGDGKFSSQEYDAVLGVMKSAGLKENLKLGNIQNLAEELQKNAEFKNEYVALPELLKTPDGVSDDSWQAQSYSNKKVIKEELAQGNPVTESDGKLIFEKDGIEHIFDSTGETQQASLDSDAAGNFGLDSDKLDALRENYRDAKIIKSEDGNIKIINDNGQQIPLNNALASAELARNEEVKATAEEARAEADAVVEEEAKAKAEAAREELADLAEDAATVLGTLVGGFVDAGKEFVTGLKDKLSDSLKEGVQAQAEEAAEEARARAEAAREELADLAEDAALKGTDVVPAEEWDKLTEPNKKVFEKLINENPEAFRDASITTKFNNTLIVEKDGTTSYYSFDGLFKTETKATKDDLDKMGISSDEDLTVVYYNLTDEVMLKDNATDKMYTPEEYAALQKTKAKEKAEANLKEAQENLQKLANGFTEFLEQTAKIGTDFVDGLKTKAEESIKASLEKQKEFEDATGLPYNKYSKLTPELQASVQKFLEADPDAFKDSEFEFSEYGSLFVQKNGGVTVFNSNGQFEQHCPIKSDFAKGLDVDTDLLGEIYSGGYIHVGYDGQITIWTQGKKIPLDEAMKNAQDIKKAEK